MHMPDPAVGLSVDYLARVHKMAYHSVFLGGFFVHLRDEGVKTRGTADRDHPLPNQLNPTGDRVFSGMSRPMI